ncbi:VanW family protein [Streptomyces spiramenti]|uniref:VanW family protein n=1 Tax=Streptomyces spiramenti TaxID=2720606 RepID=UPI001ADDB466|nr:VanW family protein [Streptomyces spiramenti]
MPPPPAEPPRISGTAEETSPSVTQRLKALPRPALVAGAVAVALGGGLLVASLAVDSAVAQGTTVLGVDIGGLGTDEAREKLAAELPDLTDDPLQVHVGEMPEDAADPHLIVPSETGLSVDVAATVDRADSPGLFGRLFGGGGGPVSPVTALDEDRGRAAMEELAEATGTEHTEGGVAFVDGEIEITDPSSGASLDVDAALQRLREAFLTAEASAPLSLPVTAAQPEVDEAEVERAVNEFARPAMSGPVRLAVGDDELELTPAMISPYLSMEPDDEGTLVPRLDGEGLATDDAVLAAVDGVDRPALNARLAARDGGVQVTADARTGVEVDTEDLGDQVMPLLTNPEGSRTGQATVTTTEPELTRDNVGELGVVEQMSSFTVDFDPAPYRTTNIGRAVELINGSVVAPGERWSFNETVGERTEENGFVEGIIILNDQYQTAQGGGVSAVATTMFNAVFFAGVKPVEYGAHSFYIERYPEGREATVAWGSLDNSFENDSDHSIYISATSDASSVTISFLGTKKYDEVESVTGDRTNIVEPATREAVADDCVAQPPLEGFDVVVERVFRNGGAEVGREEFTTRYTPRDEVVCEAEGD